MKIRKVIKVTTLIIIIFLVSLAILLMVSFIYENRQQPSTERYSNIGSQVSHNEKNLHYVREGTGNISVVMSSGNGTVFPYADLYDVQNELRQSYETIIYDRPGYGFSDKPDSDRGIENITDEVTAIIDDSTNNDELILVAHSMASLEILNFAEHNSDRVKGIVLIDGAHPSFAADIESNIPLAIQLTRFAKNVGVLRLLSNIDDMKNNLMPPTNYPEKYDQMILDFILSETWNDTMIKEREMLNKNGGKLSNLENLKTTPIKVITAANNPMENWSESQQQFEEISEDVELIEVETDNHFIHYEEPDLVVRIIESVANQ